jgi:hypothetical protein
MAAAARGSVASSAATSPIPSAKRCGVCGRTYDAEEWIALPAIGTLPASSVRAHLSVSAEWAVDLRGCACGAVLAATRR